MNDGQAALVYSVGLHVTVATVAWVGLPMMDRDRPDYTPPPIMIDFVEIAEETSAPAPKVEAPKEEPKKTPPKQTNYAKEKVVETAPAEAIPTLEKAKKKTDIKPTTKPQLTQRELVTARVRPSFKPKPPSRFKSSKLAALLDKSAKKERMMETVEKEQKAEDKAEENRPTFTDFRSRIAKASLFDAMRARVQECWNIPSGVKGVYDMRVTLRVQLRPDGSLMRLPETVENLDLNSEGQEGLRTFVESAHRAILACAPYSELPAQRYDEWKDLHYYFDPSAVTR